MNLKLRQNKKYIFVYLFFNSKRRKKESLILFYIEKKSIKAKTKNMAI